MRESNVEDALGERAQAATQDHLEEALDEADAPAARYHLRQALQFVEGW